MGLFVKGRRSALLLFEKETTFGILIIIAIVEVDAREKLGRFEVSLVDAGFQVLEAPNKLLAFVSSVFYTDLITVFIQLSIDYLVVWDGDVACGLLKVHGAKVTEGCIEHSLLILKCALL